MATINPAAGTAEQTSAIGRGQINSMVIPEGLTKSSRPNDKPLLVLEQHTDETPLLMVVNERGMNNLVVEIVLVSDTSPDNKEAIQKYIALANETELNLMGTVLIMQREGQMRIYGYLKLPSGILVEMSAGSSW